MTSLSPLRIGSLQLDLPVVLAALSGYSDWPARTIARRLGTARARRFIRVEDEDHPCAAQLMGEAGEELVPAALRLVAAGFDVIDLNLACPVRKVLARGRGGDLLRRPMEALEIIARLREALPTRVPLTLKLRSGFDGSEESRANVFAILQGDWQRGIDAVTVHGRTVRQRYEGRSCWRFVREVKQAAGGRVVLGSGDLIDAAACLDMIARTGVDGVTVARGAIGNPWVFQQVRALAAGEEPRTPELGEQGRVIGEHYRLAEDLYGPKRACRRMTKFGIKYARLHPQSEQVRDAFAAVRRPDQWRDVLQRFYGVEAGL